MIERMLGVVSKRANTRISYPKLEATIRHKNQSNNVELIDLSCHGLRFRSKKRYNAGDKLWFDIINIEDEPLLSVSIKGGVVNDYSNNGDVTYDYGVKFHRIRYMNEIEQIHSYVHKMKKNFIITTLVVLAFASPVFSQVDGIWYRTLITVEDARGNIDSAVFYVIEGATNGIDPEFGEINLFGQEPTSDLDIRIIQRTRETPGPFDSDENIDLKVDYRPVDPY